MNKARIMLSALGVLAVIGSALAFKAHSIYGGNLKCATSTTLQGAADIDGTRCTSLLYSTTSIGGAFRHCKSIQAADTEPCKARKVTTNP